MPAVFFGFASSATSARACGLVWADDRPVGLAARCAAGFAVRRAVGLVEPRAAVVAFARAAGPLERRVRDADLVGFLARPVD